MIQKDKILGHHPPLINFLALPDDEHSGCIFLSRRLSDIWGAARTFDAALALFNFSKDKASGLFQDDRRLHGKITEWKLIAARDGVWSIHNFGESLKIVRAACRKLPTLSSWLDTNKTRTAFKKFESWFPDYEKMRNAVGHSPDITRSPENESANVYVGPFQSDGMIVAGNATQIMIKNSLKGNVYQTTFDGNLISYEISEGTLEKLVAVKDEFYSGFDRAVAESSKVPHWRPNHL